MPASMNAVPYREPPAPPTLATSSCPRSRRSSPTSREAASGADRPHRVREADAHVLTVVAVAEARVEPVEQGAMTHRSRSAPDDPGTEVLGRELIGSATPASSRP